LKVLVVALDADAFFRMIEVAFPPVELLGCTKPSASAVRGGVDDDEA
jgi:hypothetical protein